MGSVSQFRFLPDGRFLVDAANGLRLKVYQWPEFNFSVAVEPVAGPQAEAWPIAARAYFEFGMGRSQFDGEWFDRVSFAIAHVPFERDFPGRTGDLLDEILPQICPFYAADVGGAATCQPISPRLRPLLMHRGSYFSHRDD